MNSKAFPQPPPPGLSFSGRGNTAPFPPAATFTTSQKPPKELEEETDFHKKQKAKVFTPITTERRLFLQHAFEIFGCTHLLQSHTLPMETNAISPEAGWLHKSTSSQLMVTPSVGSETEQLGESLLGLARTPEARDTLAAVHRPFLLHPSPSGPCRRDPGSF